jgi:hypothetical protein
VNETGDRGNTDVNEESDIGLDAYDLRSVDGSSN